MKLSTCDLADNHPNDVRVLVAQMRDFGAHRRFAGPAVTIKCFEDNSRIKERLATPGNGRVLVVDAGGSLRCAVVGDMIASDAVANGWAGLIIYGCVRDTATLATLTIGIKAIAAIPQRSTRRGEGSIDIAIEIGGVKISPGDMIVADEDGVIAFAESDWQSIVKT